MRNNKGFSLIELMITVAIIGILSMMAVPFYLDYVTRSKVSEALTIVQAYKSNVIEHYANNSVCPDNVNGPVGGIPGASEISGNYLMRLRVNSSNAPFVMNGEVYNANCVMSLTFVNDDRVPSDLRRKTLRIRLAIDRASIIFQCSTDPLSAGGLPWKYVPKICHNY